MNVHLIDGTYELFRHYFAIPGSVNDAGQEVAATRGVCGSLLAMLEDGATHMAVATDHVIESFRNDLWPGYKDGSGIDPDLFAQFPLMEDALESMGIDEAGAPLAPGECTQLARTKYPWVRCEATADGALTFSGPTRSATWANSTTMLVFDRWMEEQHVFTPISLRPSP